MIGVIYFVTYLIWSKIC